MATCTHANNSIQGDVNERNPGRNHKSLFCTDKVFKSRQDLTNWVQNVGHSLGFVIITKRSNTSGGVTRKVMLMCDRCGIYKSQSSHKHYKTKKTNCPFKLVGRYSMCGDFWTLKVLCDKHNHEPAPAHMKDHPYARRLSDNETRLVLDLSKKNVKPQVILMILKKLNPNNMSTLQTIYNVRTKFRIAGEKFSGEEMASPSLTEWPVYAFNGNKSKGASDDIDPFAIRNLLQDLDLSKYGYDVMVTPNLVNDVSVASRVKEVFMCNDGNCQYINASASTSAGPFKPYRDVVLDKSQLQVSMKHFLDSDYAHDQFLPDEGLTENEIHDQISKEEGGTEKEREVVVEHHTNTAVESIDDEGNIDNVYSDVDVGKTHDTCDENARKFPVNGTSEFSTDRVFKSRQELMDWVQNVGRSLGYIIITKRSSTYNCRGGVMCQVTLMCDHCGIYDSQSSNKHSKLTKNINCPFKLVGKTSDLGSDSWTLRVICEEHNHEPASVHIIKNHPSAMRLSDNETRLVLDLSRKNVKPKVILMILKKLNPNNISNISTIYNTRHKFRDAGEKFSGEEMATMGPTDSFNANNSKEASDDHIDPFAIRNVLQDLDLSKYGYTDMTVTNLVKDLSVASRLKDVSVTSRVEEVLMCHDGNGQYIDGDASTSAGPFKPYRDIVLDKSQGQFSMNHFLDSDNDVAVDKKLDTCDEIERNFAVNGTSEFSTNRVFNSREELTDWVQNLGRSLGYIIITKRSNTYNSSGGVMCKVTLMCDRCGIYKSQSSLRHPKLSKKTNCPFKLVGENSKCSKFWTLKLICEEHNHEPAAEHIIKGHPYAMRLSDNETRLVLDLTKKNVKPHVILMILKKLNPDNRSNLKTLYNMRRKFRNAGEKISCEDMATPNPTECPVYAFNANGASDDIDPFALRNLLQELDLSKYGYTDMMVTPNLVKDVSVASRVKDMLMCHDGNGQDKIVTYADASTSAGPFKPYRDVVLDKSQGQISMKHFLDIDFAHDHFLSEEGETEKESEETFVVHNSNNEEGASSSPLYTTYSSDANNSKRTNIEENVSPNTSFAFVSSIPKRSIEQAYRFDFRNDVQEVDSAECEPVREDIEEDFVFPPRVDIMVKNNGNGPDTVASYADKSGPFQPNREAVLYKPQREIQKKRFLDRDYAHDQSLNTAVDLTCREDKFNYVYSDVAVDKKLAVDGASEFFTERDGGVVDSQMNVAFESTDKHRNIEFVKMDNINLNDYVEQFLETPWLNEDMNGLYQIFNDRD